MGTRLLIGVAIAAIAGGAVWGFSVGQAERGTEAERERPVKAPQRLSRINNDPTITLDAATLRASGLELAIMPAASQRQQVRAYGTVLDLQSLIDLAHSMSSAQAQLLSAEAKVAATKPAFDRAVSLHKNGQIVSM